MDKSCIHIEKLPAIAGFSWWQFIELYPENKSQQDLTNVKIYMEMLNPGVIEEIQNVYNMCCTEKHTKQCDTLFHLESIMKQKCG
jgi:hypothetical protein